LKQLTSIFIHKSTWPTIDNDWDIGEWDGDDGQGSEIETTGVDMQCTRLLQ